MDAMGPCRAYSNSKGQSPRLDNDPDPDVGSGCPRYLAASHSVGPVVWGGAGGTRTHTGRILNPVPLPLGYGPWSARPRLPSPVRLSPARRGLPGRQPAYIPRSLRSLATCPVALTP